MDSFIVNSMRVRALIRRVTDASLGMVLPAAAFVAIAGAGFSFVTMLPHTARAHSGCTQCVHDVTHWTCGASNSDNVRCHKSSASLCMNLQANCVGSTTAISGGDAGRDGGDGDYSISTTTD